MYPEILTDKQESLLPLIQRFSDDYYLIGGTAVALQIKHRRTVDFDLFTRESIKRIRIQRIICENIDFIDEQIPMDIIKNFLVNVATTQFDV